MARREFEDDEMKWGSSEIAESRREDAELDGRDGGERDERKERKGNRRVRKDEEEAARKG